MTSLPHPDAFDRPVAEFLNTHVVFGPMGDFLLSNAASMVAATGGLLVALIAYLWLGSAPEMRERILLGTVAAVMSSFISRFMQHFVHSHPRPMHDALLHFNLPQSAVGNVMNRYDGFPSDHAAVWFGLVTVIYLANRRLGLLMGLWILIPLYGRIYAGAHYPSDIVGGAALGVLVTSLSLSKLPTTLGKRVVDWGDRHPAAFYSIALFASYQIATLFGELRTFGMGVAKLLSIHPI